jgi:hypothetical protein
MDNNFSPLKVDLDPVFKANPKKEIDTEHSPLITGVYGVLNNQNYIPDQPLSEQTENIPVPKSNTKSSIRTYKDDIEEAIQTSHLSSVNIAMAENDKMRGRLIAENAGIAGPSGAYSKNKIALLISILLVVIGIGAIGITYLVKNQSSNTIIPTQVITSIITTEYKDELNVNSVVKNRFLSALASKINDIQIPVNNIYNVYITTGASTTKRLINSGEFVAFTELRMPDMIKRTLASNFMVGMYSSTQNLPFIIFKTSSFENTYAGMLEWEKYLEKDFSVLFRFSDTNANGGLAASLTPTTQKTFTDAVIVNQNARVLRDADGKITFLYAILDKNTIVLTVNDTAFKEIVSRLNKEKGLKR